MKLMLNPLKRLMPPTKLMHVKDDTGSSDLGGSSEHGPEDLEKYRRILVVFDTFSKFG